MNPTRLNAIKQGATTFDPGQPCKYGHDSPRYTRSGQCVTCSKETSRKAYQAMVELMPERETKQEEKVLIPRTIYLNCLNCLKCGHRWRPRKDEVRQCPRCQSVWWNTPKDGHIQPQPTRGQAKAKAKAKPKPKKGPPTFETWWNEVKNSPAYAGIDCDRELERMKVWLTTPKGKSRQLTKAFAVNWLNRIDAPISIGIGEPCTARVRNQDGTRYVPCGKPSIRKQGLGFLCVECDREYQKRQVREGQE